MAIDWDRRLKWRSLSSLWTPFIWHFVCFVLFFFFVLIVLSLDEVLHVHVFVFDSFSFISLFFWWRWSFWFCDRFAFTSGVCTFFVHRHGFGSWRRGRFDLCYKILQKSITFITTVLCRWGISKIFWYVIPWHIDEENKILI